MTFIYDNYYNEMFTVSVLSGTNRIQEEITLNTGKISQETIEEVENLLQAMKEYNQAQDKKEGKNGK